jgi:hypothetical protein
MLLAHPPPSHHILIDLARAGFAVAAIDHPEFH